MSPPPDNAGVATPHNTAPAHPQVWPGIREWSQGRGRTASSDTAWRLFLRRPGGVAGVIVLSLLIGTAVFSGLIWPGDPLATVAEPLLWPGQNAQYPLGTDSLGRDMAAMIAHGARTSLSVGVFAAAVGLSVGILLGSLSGYFGGWVDAIITRVTELFQSTPMFLLIVVAVALFQPSPVVISLAIGLTTWEQISRLIRAEFRQQLNSDFVTAARSSGIGTVDIITREILPNVLPSVIVMASFKVAAAIFMESSLAFLGLGDASTVSWGGMINEGRDFLRTAWFLSVVPGIAIVLTVLSLNLIGDALNHALNPRLRRLS